MNNGKPAFGISRVLLRVGWYATFLCQAIMVILWISSFLSSDSSFFFKMNLVTGILIFLINFFILRDGWELVDGTNGMNILYLITGILMILNVFCIPVAVVYLGIPLFMRIKEGIELRG
ncbi:hypothetical protein P7D93_19060 [Enterococcus raffinosus]|uniref:hypothetical protein n=1 Tax=Enterococcus raffinosus TaxID=71452 RepID=UPI00289238D5|nr:hypothetical protein [Enterococcus raffinosus]MDT2531963.1 hypothetical protein [Enterococcus raffinosus]